MVYKITITPSALNDLQEALDYYNEISPNLGYRITDEIDNSLTDIAKMPLAYSFRYKNVRAKLLPKFPYLIFFICNPDKQTITVLRIFNTHQSPYWLTS